MSGQHLTVGTPVAAVGDSGDGSEPALHLRAETRTSQPDSFYFHSRGLAVRGK